MDLEVEVLRSVYDHVQVRGRTIQAKLEEGLVVSVDVPEDYPDKSPPLVEPGLQSLMEELFEPGEEVLLRFLEEVRQRHDVSKQAPETAKCPPPPPSGGGAAISTQPEDLDEFMGLDSSFYSSAVVSVAKSRFQAHAARCYSQKDALERVSIVQRKYAKATHNMWAYSLANSMSDNDDDGESAAGSRLAELLYLLKLKNVVVVVTRYYGGVKLGPQRFKIINQVAREALERLPEY